MVTKCFVEDMERFGQLCHYIHLNPIRAKICDINALKEYAFNSYRLLWKKRLRPAFFEVNSFLESAGMLADNSRGRNKYAEYLNWLVEDNVARKSLNFEQMSKGWVHGTKEFKQSLLSDQKNLRASLKLGINEAKEIREAGWECRLKQSLKILKITGSQLRKDPKSSAWRVAIAGLLKNKMGCSNVWAAENLQMGSEYGVSRYVSEMNKGTRKEAGKLYQKLTARIKD